MGAQNTQNSRFPCKSALLSKKVCYKVSLCKNCKQQSYKAFTGLSNRAKMVDGDVPLYVKIWPKLTHPFQKPDFQLTFPRSASAVTPREKSSNNTKESLRAFQWASDEQCTLFLSPPKRGSKTQSKVIVFIQNLNNNQR